MDKDDEIQKFVEKTVKGQSIKSTIAAALIKGAMEGLLKIFVK